MIDDVLDENNPFNNTMKTETEDIYFNENLFDDTDKKDIKIISEDILQETNIDQNEVLFEDFPEELPSRNTTIGFNPYRLKEINV